MRSARRAAALLALALLPATPARAQDERPGSVVFVVVDAEGAAVAGAEVGVWDDDDLLDATTDAEGRARISGVDAGPWTAWAAAEEHTGEEQEVAVEPGEVTVRFTLGPGVPFSGRVVNDAGEPVEDAYVQALAGGTFEGYTEMKTRPPYDRVVTDAEGAFRIRGIPPGAVTTLVVRADGMAEVRLAARAQGGAVRPAPIEIVLDRGGVLVGSVVGPQGEPAPGALVFVVPANAPELIRNPRMRISSDDGWLMATWTRADETGAFEVIGLPFGKPVVAMAEARGFARSVPTEPLTPSEAARVMDVALALRPAATLAVRLVTPDGEPVTAAEVQIGSDFEFGPSRDAADADATFRFEGLSDGEVALHIDAKGWLPQVVKAALRAGEATELEITLDPGATVSGVVVDEQGAPVDGVDVALDYELTHENGGWESGTAASAKTGADGRFELRGLRRMEHTLRATAQGLYAPPEETKVTAPASDLKVVVRKMGSLRVRFVSPDPEAVPLPPKTMVWRHDLDDGFGSGMRQPLEDGVLVLRGGCGKRERLTVQFDTFLTFEQEICIPWGEEIDLGDVQLDPGVTLSGRIVDLDGAPVGGALVDWSGVREAVTGPDGAFVLEHVPSGGTDVAVEAEGFLPLESRADTGPDAGPATLVLHRGALVKVRLVDAAGEPLADHWLQFRRPPTSADEPKGEHLDETDTDDDGRLAIRLPAGPCRVLFVEDDEIHVLATLDLTEGGDESVDATLDR